MKFLLRAVVSLLVLTVLLCGGLILYLSITEYKPAEAMPVQILQQQNRPIDAASELTITTFNTVSYTHLDVYKRQSLTVLFSLFFFLPALAKLV